MKNNIEKVKQLLQSESYEAGFELLKTINEPEVTEAITDLIQSTVKEKYFVHETYEHYSSDFEKTLSSNFDKGLDILSTLIPNLTTLDLSDIFPPSCNDEIGKHNTHNCIKLLNKLKNFNNLTELFLYKCSLLQAGDGLEKVIKPGILKTPKVFTDVEIWSTKQELHDQINDLFKNGCYGNSMFKEEGKFISGDVGSSSIVQGYETDIGNSWSTNEELYLKYSSDLPTYYNEHTDPNYNKSQCTLLNFTSVYSAPVAYLKKLIQNIIDIDETAEVWFRASEEFCPLLYDDYAKETKGDKVLVWGGYGSKEGFKWYNDEILDMPLEEDYESWEYWDEAIGDYTRNVISGIDYALNEAYNELKGV